MTNKEIEQYVKAWMNSHEPDTFVKNENGVVMYSAGHSSINLTLFFEDLLEDFAQSSLFSEKDREIEELKKEIKEMQIVEKDICDLTWKQNKIIQSLKSQPDSKGGYDAETLAIIFHDTYEGLAKQYGYTTREETKVFDKNSNNGKLMIATCEKILALSSKEGSKGREIEFAEWIDGKYNKESDDEYILKSDFQIPYKDEDCDPKTIKQLYEIFCMEFPVASKEGSEAGFSEDDTIKIIEIIEGNFTKVVSGEFKGKWFHNDERDDIYLTTKELINSIHIPTSKVEATTEKIEQIKEIIIDYNFETLTLDEAIDRILHLFNVSGQFHLPSEAKPSIQEGEKTAEETIFDFLDYCDEAGWIKNIDRKRIVNDYKKAKHIFTPPTDSKEAVEVKSKSALLDVYGQRDEIDKIDGPDYMPGE